MKTCRSIAMINQKGGVGKTTSTVNIGAALANSGKRVLLIDFDPQAHLTSGVGLKPHELEHTVYDVLNGSKSLEDVTFEKFGLEVLPSSLRLSGSEIELSSVPGREFLLKEVLDKYRVHFDYIIIDCSPSLGLLAVNALTAVNEVIIPLQTEFFALHGLKHLLETISIVQKRLNQNLSISGIIATRFDGRKTLSKEVVETIKNQFGSKLFQTMIRDNVSLAEAPSFGQTIFNYKNSSSGALDYLNLTKEIMKNE